MSHNGQRPFISVIVPVYNGTMTLPELFTSLLNLDYDRRYFEIIFVDNGSTDNSLALIRGFVSDYDGKSSVLLEDRKVGSYAARNRAIPEAEGDIIAFTDADCQVSVNWLKELRKALLKMGGRTIIGGRVDLTSRISDSPNSVEMYEMLLGFSQRNNVARYGFSVTANLATWRDAFPGIGLFAELKSKGDFEWCQRASQHGYKVQYAHDVVVSHPARSSFRDVLTKSRRVTGGQFDLLKSGEFCNNKFKKRSLEEMWFTVIRNQRFPHWHQKMNIVIVAGFVALAKIYERIRLKMGFRSERR